MPCNQTRKMIRNSFALCACLVIAYVFVITTLTCKYLPESRQFCTVHTTSKFKSKYEAGQRTITKLRMEINSSVQAVTQATEHLQDRHAGVLTGNKITEDSTMINEPVMPKTAVSTLLPTLNHDYIQKAKPTNSQQQQENVKKARSTIKLASNDKNKNLNNAKRRSSVSGPVKYYIYKQAYTYNPPDIHCTNATLVFIVVISRADDFAGRDTVRKTWGLEASGRKEVVLTFLVADVGDSKIKKNLNMESQMHGDMIQASFMENYYNLTMKSVTMLHLSLTLCPQAQFTMKIDTDVFLNVPNLLKLLSRSNKSRLIAGRGATSSKPLRNRSHKWYVSKKQYPFSTYPPYVHGPGYVLSRDVVRLLYQASTTTPPFVFEDIYVTGILASQIGISSSNLKVFSNVRNQSLRHMETPSSMKNIIILHSMNSTEIFNAWKKSVGEL